MFNFEQRYKVWQERMSKKTEQEKHNYALVVAIIFTIVAAFFVISSWYFRIMGDDVKTSLLTDLVQFYESRTSGVEK